MHRFISYLEHLNMIGESLRDVMAYPTESLALDIEWAKTAQVMLITLADAVKKTHDGAPTASG